jgi:hypothetical protein
VAAGLKPTILAFLFNCWHIHFLPSWNFFFSSITCWCQQWLHLNSTLRINSSLLYQICYCHTPYNLFVSFHNYLLVSAEARFKPSNFVSIIICYTNYATNPGSHFINISCICSSARGCSRRIQTIDLKRITRCKLALIFTSADHRKFLGLFWF